MKDQLRSLLKRSGPRCAPELTFDDYIAERVGIWSEAPPVSGALVFLGDSQIERGRWNEWWTHRPVLNRGIGGETIGHVQARLEEVVRHAPPLLVLECGANDMSEQTPLDSVAKSYRGLLKKLRDHLPDCLIWAQGILPVHFSYWRDLPLAEASEKSKERNARVREVNERLETIAREAGALFFDLHPFLEESGALRASCTLDGLHLNGVGYRVWREAIQQGAPTKVADFLNSPS